MSKQAPRQRPTCRLLQQMRYLAEKIEAGRFAFRQVFSQVWE